MVIIILWLLIVLFFSVIPVRSPQTNLPTDKIVHFVVYGITSFIFFRVLRLKLSFTKSIILSVIIASSYGFAMEVLQYALPWREFSLLDEMANIIGASSTGIIYSVRNYCNKRVTK
jgi:VanZ family protein